MLEQQDKSHYDDPVYQTDLSRFDSDVVLDIHDFLQFFVTLLDLATGIYDMKVNTVQN